jgi:putative oxidoreductase
MMVSTVGARWSAFAPRLLSVLRITAVWSFMLHGTAKLFAWPNAVTPDGSTVQLLSQVGAAGVLETVGGALLMLGLFTRPVAFLLSGEMAVAYLQFHIGTSIFPTMNNGEPALLFCFLWLFYSAAGAGPWSLDARRSRSA